jgi:RimJ/RimL family protein N-acetyltransferase
MRLELKAIQPSFQENAEFLQHAECVGILEMSVTYYSNIGYHPPWIGYFVLLDGKFVGSAGFKGRPRNGMVELAYGTFPGSQRQGIGTGICSALVQLALNTDPTIRVMARTLPEENYSTKILRKNGFEWQGIVVDDDDGDVWEWEFKGGARWSQTV